MAHSRADVGQRDTPAAPFRGDLRVIVATAVAAAAVIVLARARIVGVLSTGALADPVGSAALALGAAFEDLSFVAASTAVFVALALVSRHSRTARRAVTASFLAYALLLLTIYLCHISVMKFLSRPFTYQWLYYSDFLGSLPVRQAVVANLNAALLSVAGAAVALFLAFRWTAGLALRRLEQARPAALAPVCVAGALAILAVSAWSASRFTLPYSQRAQPVVTFVASLFHEDPTAIQVAGSPAVATDFEPQANAPGPVRAGPSLIRNVVFFVFESAAAEYFSAYGSTLGVTPELDKRRSSSIVVSDAYAHAPNTNMSLVSLLTGTYPWVKARLITAEFPDIRLTSISAMLQGKGYRTGFFSAADLRFHKAEAFLAHQGLETVRDYRTIACDTEPYKGAWRETFSSLAVTHLGGITDECAVDAMTAWIAERPEQPFFGVAWTNQAHYPYILTAPSTAYPVRDKELERYLNALRSGDRALGKLLGALEARGLSESTLVVVLGDHGQAFGQHGDRVHGSAIYEPNVRIPLIFINPRLFKGEVVQTVGGMADVAPTVGELLGLPRAATWQGRSLLDSARPSRTYFFTPWADAMFGYRDGDLKYLYNATYGRFEIYDVVRDPGERVNLAARYPERLESVRQRLAAWIQFQDRFIATRARAPSAGDARAAMPLQPGRVAAVRDDRPAEHD